MIMYCVSQWYVLKLDEREAETGGQSSCDLSLSRNQEDFDITTESKAKGITASRNNYENISYENSVVPLSICEDFSDSACSSTAAGDATEENRYYMALQERRRDRQSLAYSAIRFHRS